MTLITLLLVCLALPAMIYASKMCTEDADCEELGKELFCMKSRCQWGFCGCPRGRAMRWLGSRNKFKCVPIHRVGEPCSTDGDAGVCGAENSECIHGKCICDHRENAGIIRRWSYWGGEHCDTQLKSAEGETCSDSLGPGCSLQLGFTTCKTGNYWWDSPIPPNTINSPLDTLPNTCACQDGARVSLENDFQHHAFTGHLRPMCVAIKFGELCLRDLDCTGSGQSGMECVNQKCACVIGTEVPDLAGTTCKLPRAKGVICDGSGLTGFGHCDGSKGLVCGNVCDVATYWNGTITKKCICDQSYGDGDPCSKAAEGTSCEVDYNCRSWTTRAVCVDGACVDGATCVYVSLVLMSALLALTRLFHS